MLGLHSRLCRRLVFWFSARRDVYKDATLTDRAIVDGDAVVLASGIAGFMKLGSDLGTTPALKLAANGINGFPAVSIDSVGQASCFGSQFLPPSGAWVCYCVIGGTGGIGASAIGRLALIGTHAAHVRTGSWIDPTGAGASPTAASPQRNDVSGSPVGVCVAFGFAGSGGVSIAHEVGMFNGVPVVVTSTTVSAMAASPVFRFAASTADPILVGDVMFFTGVKHSSSEMNSISRFLLGRYGLTY